jgi:hypothetical protein
MSVTSGNPYRRRRSAEPLERVEEGRRKSDKLWARKEGTESGKVVNEGRRRRGITKEEKTKFAHIPGSKILSLCDSGNFTIRLIIR